MITQSTTFNKSRKYDSLTCGQKTLNYTLASNKVTFLILLVTDLLTEYLENFNSPSNVPALRDQMHKNKKKMLSTNFKMSRYTEYRICGYA